MACHHGLIMVGDGDGTAKTGVAAMKTTQSGGRSKVDRCRPTGAKLRPARNFGKAITRRLARRERVISGTCSPWAAVRADFAAFVANSRRIARAQLLFAGEFQARRLSR